MTPCTAQHKCWEHFQGWHTRVTTRDIDLALALVRLHASTIAPSVASLQRLQDATELATSLINRQWREMTREPFAFAPPAAITTPAPKPRPARPTLDDVL